MNPAVAFLMNFLAYGIVLVLIVALIIVACVIGIKCRKSKDAKTAVETPSQS